MTAEMGGLADAVGGLEHERLLLSSPRRRRLQALAAQDPVVATALAMGDAHQHPGGARPGIGMTQAQHRADLDRQAFELQAQAVAEVVQDPAGVRLVQGAVVGQHQHANLLAGRRQIGVRLGTCLGVHCHSWPGLERAFHDYSSCRHHYWPNPGRRRRANLRSTLTTILAVARHVTECNERVLQRIKRIDAAQRLAACATPCVVTKYLASMLGFSHAGRLWGDWIKWRNFCVTSAKWAS